MAELFAFFRKIFLFVRGRKRARCATKPYRNPLGGTSVLEFGDRLCAWLPLYFPEVTLKEYIDFLEVYTRGKYGDRAASVRIMR